MPQVDNTSTTLDLKALSDFLDPAAETFAKHRVEFVLAPHLLCRPTYAVSQLTWHEIRFDDRSSLATIPDDKRGVYAFSIKTPCASLPPHGYILYVGIAGLRSNRSLRARYNDYLKTSHVIKRPRIARMISTWYSVLSFLFAPVPDEVSPTDLEALEEQLLSALIPPCSDRGMDADLSQQMRAFR